MPKQSADQDRNFDDLAKRFQKNIYGGLKGQIRLAVLNRDCAKHLPIPPFTSTKTSWRILDAGGGQGQFSLDLAAAGHQVVLCDISSEMLKIAAEDVSTRGLESQVVLLQTAIQDLQNQLPENEHKFDLVICHAVMEWLQDPSQLITHLCKYLKPGGYLSLIFYNLDSLIFKNCLRTNFKKIIQKDYAGSVGSLTPINPLTTTQVMHWISKEPLEILSHSGIRVFHDYILNDAHKEKSAEELINMELQLSQQEPFRSLGRYIHLLMRFNSKSLA
jgi:S-adenosylmethionine-dependent methyltransferase